MKKIAYLVIATALVGLSACNDSFLDREPITDLNNSKFWKSETDLIVYNNGIYNEMATNNYPYFRGNASGAAESKWASFMGMEAVSDNFATTDGNLNTWLTIGSGKNVIPAGATTTTGNSWRWGFLYRCNFFLENYEKATSVPENVRNQYAGEVYFWRAWFYFDKIQEYGEVPLVLTTLNDKSPELYAAQDDRTTVMTSVLDDIDKAIAFLPESWPPNLPDRVTKTVALALKSRIFLYEGTWRKYHGLPNFEFYLTESVKASTELITGAYSNRYRIHNTGNPNSDYRALFTSRNLRTNPEVILPKLYASPGLGHAVVANIVGTSPLFAGATKCFVDDFLINEDGQALPIALSTTFNDDAIENIFDNRDPRLGQTILDPRREQELAGTNNGYYPQLAGMPYAWKSITGYHYIKNYNPADIGIQGSAELTQFPVLRYAEVLLNHAEAKAELGTITLDDLNLTINRLRDRVNMPRLTTLTPPMDPKYAGEGISSLLVEIRRERRVELSFENSRYHDLMRWKKGTYLNKRVLGMRLEDADKAVGQRYAGTTVTTVEIDGKKYIDVYAGLSWAVREFNENKNYLYPVPTNVRARNPNLRQTPGWETP